MTRVVPPNGFRFAAGVLVFLCIVHTDKFIPQTILKKQWRRRRSSDEANGLDGFHSSQPALALIRRQAIEVTACAEVCHDPAVSHDQCVRNNAALNPGQKSANCAAIAAANKADAGAVH